MVARFFSGEEHLAKNMKREAEVYRISNVCTPCIGGVEYSGYESDSRGTKKNNHTRVEYCTIHFGFEVCGSTCASTKSFGKVPHFNSHKNIFLYQNSSL